jgi:hypothetical protein
VSDQLTLLPPGRNGARPGPALATLAGRAPALPGGPVEGSAPAPTPVEAPTSEPAASAPALTPAPRKPAPKKAAAKKPAAKAAAQRSTAPAGRPQRKAGRRVTDDQVFAVAGYAVALAAVMVSLSHMYEVAHLAGQGWRSLLLPVSVDGLALVSVMAVRRCRRLDLTPDRLVVGSLVLSVLASLAANVVASDPGIVPLPILRWVVGAWPPIAFLLAELVIKQWHRAAAGVRTSRRPGASPNPTSPKPKGRPAR